MNMALDKLVMKNKDFHFSEVRSEGKLLVSMLRGWRCYPNSQPDA
jgi:hypothetical protein